MSKQAIYLALVALVLGAAHVQAQEFEWIRAAYWDDRYPGAWGGNGIAMRDALEGAGYEVLDADALKVWMEARIADREYSVVVFCLDVVPDTVAETMTDACTLRRYLNAGGKIVWYSDWPFYYQGTADGSMVTWTGTGATDILGFNASTGPNDSYATVTITELGAAWGLTETWESRRPTGACEPGGPTVWSAIPSTPVSCSAAWVICCATRACPMLCSGWQSWPGSSCACIGRSGCWRRSIPRAMVCTWSRCAGGYCPSCTEESSEQAGLSA